jgi:NAD(P)-dependent dehydrogenase (short-subunit alcohol dehydrogenase family)
MGKSFSGRDRPEDGIMTRLSNKTALITGGTSGIGLETARQFLKEGARVAITGRDAKNLEAAGKELEENVLLIPSDAGDIAGQKKVADTIRQEFGGLDILFLNAGVVEMAPLEKWDERGFDRSFNTNFKGPFFLIQALLPLFHNPASIVLMTSINTHIGMPNSSVYGATKGALLSLARTLSGELISRGIRVNAVTGGPIETPLYRKLGMGEKELQGLASQIPTKRFGKPSEVAETVVFFASDESAFIVGSELVIDGGMSNL